MILLSFFCNLLKILLNETEKFTIANINVYFIALDTRGYYGHIIDITAFKLITFVDITKC